VRISTLVTFFPCSKSVSFIAYSNLNDEPLVDITLSKSTDVELTPNFFGKFSVTFVSRYGGIYFGVSDTVEPLYKGHWE